MLFAALQSVMSTPVVDVFGYLRPLWSHCFQPTYVVFPKMPSPISREKNRSSSHELRANFRVRRRSGPTQSSRRTLSASRGISSPIATSALQIHLFGELPTTRLRSALSVSHALDGLLPAEPCGFVSSRSHVLGSPYKGFPCYQADAPRRSTVPSWRFKVSVYRQPKPTTPTRTPAPSRP